MWLEAWALQSSCLHSHPGFTLLSSVVQGKLLNLLEPKLSHLFDGGDMTAYLTGLMRGQNDTQSRTWEAPDSHWVLLSWL